MSDFVVGKLGGVSGEIVEDVVKFGSLGLAEEMFFEQVSQGVLAVVVGAARKDLTR